MPTCLELLVWWEVCYPNWLCKERHQQVLLFSAPSSVHRRMCYQIWHALLPYKKTLSRFLLKHIKSWGPCCDLFTIGWCLWIAENKGRHDSVNKCKPDSMLPGIYNHLEELGIQKAAWGHQPAAIYQQLLGVLPVLKVWWDPQVEEGSGVMPKVFMIFLENLRTFCSR